MRVAHRPSSFQSVIIISLLLIVSIRQYHQAEANELDNDILQALTYKIEHLGGYVHPSIKLVSPSPCCQRGIISSEDVTLGNDDDQGVWVRVPPTYHLTRDLAMQTLEPLIPKDVLEYAPLSTLDDGALLLLLLVHLKGIGSKEWGPYLDSLPDRPGCGWYGDINSIADEEYKHVAQESKRYVSRVASGMAADYGVFLAKEHWPREWKNSAEKAIEWSLCIVSSRGTAASPEYGGGVIKLVPLVDMFNHSPEHKGFKELTKEDLGIDSSHLEGSFAVRIEKDYHPGEEIFVDYNLSDYAPEEWFMSHGFVPQEASHRQEL
eukprot:scaffold28746_cov129-Skeletonema_dohrnii-CCMP3373.AAC.1